MLFLDLLVLSGEWGECLDLRDVDVLYVGLFPLRADGEDILSVFGVFRV